MSASERFFFTFFNLEIDKTYLPSIAEGFLLTVVIAVCIVFSGIALGLVLAMIRSSGIRIVNFLIVAFVDLFRAIPPLVIILIFYFGLPSIGIEMSSFTVTSPAPRRAMQTRSTRPPWHWTRPPRTPWPR